MNTTNKRLGIHILTPPGHANLLPSYMVSEALVVHFENGYGASMVIGSISFGHWELAVLHNGHLCYNTPITSDVLRVDQFDDLEPLLDQLAQLPKNDNCNHERVYNAF